MKTGKDWGSEIIVRPDRLASIAGTVFVEVHKQAWGTAHAGDMSLGQQ